MTFFLLFFIHFFFFFNDTATTEIYTLSLHDALPIRGPDRLEQLLGGRVLDHEAIRARRSEEHTSELQSHVNLVCRLLLEKTNEGGSALSSEYVKKRNRDWLKESMRL